MQFDVHNVRKTDGYRLISGRSQDRNLLPVKFQFASFKEAGRQDADVKRIRQAGRKT